MGTRNLTAVVLDGEYKIAQYGQWDGNPGGQGATICAFLSNTDNINKFRTNLSKVRFFEPQGQDKEFAEAYDKNAPMWSSEPDKRTPEQKRWFTTYMTRDLGGEILNNVAWSADDEIILKNEINFAADSLFCEWAYVVDLDNEKLEVYKGFNKTPLTETDRFYFLEAKSERGYHPVRKVAELPFSEIDSDAVSKINEQIGVEEEEEEAESATV